MKNLLLIICLTFLATPAFAKLTASIDRNNISADASFTLFITSNSVFQSIHPNLAPLKKNFEIVGTSNSSSVNIINGKHTSKQSLMITLMPKHAGHLAIPALTVGKEKTNALYINVKPEIQIPQSQRNLYLQLHLNNTQSYPKQQNFLTIKLFYSLNSLTGSLSSPSVPGLRFEQLGKESQYQVKQGNKFFRVVEQRYAVFAEKPGDYTIPAITFTGSAATAQSQNSLFQITGGQPVRASSKAITLHVISPPGHSGTWLPAKQLQLSQSWSPNPPQFKVGNPITRTISLTAVGLKANRLPEINLKTPAGVNSYPDQPVSQTITNSNNVIGRKVWKVAYIPTQTGSVTFPEINIRWWNSQTKKFQTASIKSQHFTVAAAPITTSQPQRPTAAPVTTAPKATSSSYNIWAWLAGLFFLAWVATILFFWRRKQNPKHKQPKLNALRQQVKQACGTNQTQAIKHALIDWAQVKWQQPQLQTLGEIAQQAIIEQFKQAVLNLDAQLYKQQNHQVDGNAIWQAFLANEKHKSNNKKNKIKPLPPLHPRD